MRWFRYLSISKSSKTSYLNNVKVDVKDGFGVNARKQADYTVLSDYYGFEAVFYNPISGNEKGLVKGLVGYIRRNVCVPVPKVKIMDELNRMLKDKCRQYLSHQIRGENANGEFLLDKERINYILFRDMLSIPANARSVV